MKLDKETIVGLVAAVDLFMKRDYDEIYCDWDSMVLEMVNAFANVTELEARRGFPSQPGIQPADVPRVYIRPRAMSATQLQQRLRDGEPSVLSGVEGDELVLNPQTLEHDEVSLLIAATVAAVR